MHFEEQDCGGCRIYGGTFESAYGGYVAAVVVLRTGPKAELVFKDDSLSCGHTFDTPASALRHAMEAGRRAVRRQAELMTT
ncbi:unnamed protein product [Phaeothamnion confervicola]|uniref:hypothetical protein n=1 Tax=Methylibium sp. TaxID=2067992 RepID=UPI003B2F99ED